MSETHTYKSKQCTAAVMRGTSHFQDVYTPPLQRNSPCPTFIFLNACRKSPKILLHHQQPQRDTMMISQELWERSVVLRADWRGCRISAGEDSAMKSDKKRV